MSATPSCFSGGNTRSTYCCTRERRASFRRLRPSSQKRSMDYGLQASRRRHESSATFSSWVVRRSPEAQGSRVLTPCMPCSFRLLPHPRSEPRAQPIEVLEVTVVVRCIPLVTAAYGTRVARPARTTMLPPGGGRSQPGRSVRPILGEPLVVGQEPGGLAAVAPGPKWHTYYGGWRYSRRRQAGEQDGCRSAVSSCTHLSLGVTASREQPREHWGSDIFWSRTPSRCDPSQPGIGSAGRGRQGRSFRRPHLGQLRFASHAGQIDPTNRDDSQDLASLTRMAPSWQG